MILRHLLGITVVAGIVGLAVVIVVVFSPKKPDDLSKLREIAIAFVDYARAHRDRLPSPIGAKEPGPNAKPLMSWRVHLLPYLNEEAVFHEFNLDEPWDSEQNKLLIDRIPKVYISPNAYATPGKTFYKVFVSAGAEMGDDTPFNPLCWTIYPASFAEGTSNTILAVEAGPPVIWTKSEDIPFKMKQPFPNLRRNGKSTINVAMADGSVRVIDLKTMDENALRKAISIGHYQFFSPDW